MATTTTPEVGTPAKTPVTLTPTAVSKVREIMAQQNTGAGRTAHRCGGRRMLWILLFHVI